MEVKPFANSTSVNAAQSWKQLASIVRRFALPLKAVKFEPLKAEYPILTTVLGNIAFFSDEQPLNVSFLISATPLGNSMLSKEEQPKKVYSGITNAFLDNLAEISLEQLRRILSP